MRLLILVIPACCLAGCEPPAAPVAALPAPAPVADGPIIPAPPSAPATWRFSAGAPCTATLASATLSLDITASSSRMTVTARLPANTPPPRQTYVPIAFAGSGGNWNMIGSYRPSDEIVAGQALTDARANPLQSLLQGGVIKVGHTDDGLPTLRIPNAGPTGHEWMGCVGAK